VAGEMQDLGLLVAGIRTRWQDRWDQSLAVCEMMKVAASRCGSVVALAQLGHEVVNGCVALRGREGELVYARKEERLYRVALSPQFTAEAAHRWYTVDVVNVRRVEIMSEISGGDEYCGFSGKVGTGKNGGYSSFPLVHEDV
jgi:hypothetical protein